MDLIEYPVREEWDKLLSRPGEDGAQMELLLAEVFDGVAIDGDAAVLKYSSKFDRNTSGKLTLSNQELESRSRLISEDLRNAIDLAHDNIQKFHKAQITHSVSVETQPGVQCWQEKKPIAKVGIYIPGGSAPLFSTVLMLAIPAKLAGCSEIILCSPPDNSGSLHPAICYAAHKCGVTIVCPIGGIQAIAAMSLGTQSIPKVYKIFGPGNQYVTQAKQWALRLDVAIDMPAGPSELMVVADGTANPTFVAADLLSQAEHGSDSQVILLTDTPGFSEKVIAALNEQLDSLPRKSIALGALMNSKAIVLRDAKELMEMMNEYGPEHLIICHREEPFLLAGIQNAGSVFLGDFTPESAGDYASGTNHTLPTNGFTKQYSGVNLDSFLKTITYQRISSQGLTKIGPAIEIMAGAEGLDGHKRAVTFRLDAIKHNSIE